MPNKEIKLKLDKHTGIKPASKCSTRAIAPQISSYTFRYSRVSHTHGPFL